MDVSSNDLTIRDKRMCEDNECNYEMNIIIDLDLNNRTPPSSVNTAQPKSRVKRFCENNQCNFSIGSDPIIPRPYNPAVNYNNVGPSYESTYRNTLPGFYETKPSGTIYNRDNTPSKEQPGIIASMFISIKKFLFG